LQKPGISKVEVYLQVRKRESREEPQTSKVEVCARSLKAKRFFDFAKPDDVEDTKGHDHGSSAWRDGC
jgi:hypothetical protein